MTDFCGEELRWGREVRDDKERVAPKKYAPRC